MTPAQILSHEEQMQSHREAFQKEFAPFRKVLFDQGLTIREMNQYEIQRWRLYCANHGIKLPNE